VHVWRKVFRLEVPTLSLRSSEHGSIGEYILSTSYKIILCGLHSQQIHNIGLGDQTHMFSPSREKGFIGGYGVRGKCKRPTSTAESVESVSSFPFGSFFVRRPVDRCSILVAVRRRDRFCGSVLRNEKHRTPLPCNHISCQGTGGNSRFCSGEVSEQGVLIELSAPVSGWGGRWKTARSTSHRFNRHTTAAGTTPSSSSPLPDAHTLQVVNGCSSRIPTRFCTLVVGLV